jgi:hypothetical protein
VFNKNTDLWVWFININWKRCTMNFFY